jgi:hypothetical protein
LEINMRKTFLMTTAAAVLMAGSAFAQTTMPSPSAPAATAQVITTQSASQWLASKFKGTDVMGPNNEKVGDVADILFENDGKIAAYVVGVGGFLGIGSKDIAISPASFQLIPANDKESMKLKLSMTKDELKNVAEFKPRSEVNRTTSTTAPAPTTGMAPRDTTTTPPRP